MATIRETLRQRPVFPISGPRRAVGEIEIGDREYGPGCFLMPNSYLLHHDPDIYPDPYEFRPERFLGKTPGTYDWIPFDGGRRRCLGERFAMLEMRVVLKALLSRVEIVASSPGRSETARRRMITIFPGKGAKVSLRPATHPV